MHIERLSEANTTELRQLMELFATAFEDTANYSDYKPDDAYVKRLLSNDLTIVLVAKSDEGTVVGGLVAYELQKFEQERSEIYLYDLAVDEAHRRKGIATNLINELVAIGKQRGAYIVFVQADNVDKPAVALYTKLASVVETEITHFDIPVND